MVYETSYKRLIAWQKARELALHIYEETEDFPRGEVFGITSQLRRAVLSVIANIAEGYERQHRKEYVQFLYQAKGSLAEVEVFLDFAKDLHYLSEAQYESLSEKQRETGRLINALIKSLKSY
ncbi:MAG TPA: four helix bundle protein [Anaerolineae bacterium]|jgi:four helix bundle protein|nr:four helix bundle protein [Anaerolineae bacterium]